MFGFDIRHNSALFSLFPQTGRGHVLLIQYSQNQNACFLRRYLTKFGAEAYYSFPYNSVRLYKRYSGMGIAYLLLNYLTIYTFLVFVLIFFNSGVLER